MRPPRYYDQDFMAQLWSHLRGSTVMRKTRFRFLKKDGYSVT